MKLILMTLIILFIAINNIQASDCIYAPRTSEDGPDGRTSAQGDCGKVVNDDFLKMKRSHFKRLSFSEKGLAWVLIDNKAFYVSKNGKTIRTHFYDNGPDYFEEGLARTIRKNKFGFIDESLRIAIKPEYDFAFPFSNGHAVVCNECKPENHGEHRDISGGQWGVISRKGKVVIPIKYKKEDLPDIPEFKRLDIKL